MCYFSVSQLHLKGQSHKVFDPRFFSLKCTPGSPDSWAKTVLHIDSNSRIYLIKFDDENRLYAMPHSRESQLCAMLNSGESRLRTMRHCAESTHFREFLREFAIICKNVLPVDQ
jgi:hypothetical protein